MSYRPSADAVERLFQGWLNSQDSDRHVVEIMSWQRDLFRASVRSGIDRIMISMARSGGKTSTVAAIAAAWALNKPGHDIVVCASTFEQAKLMTRQIRKIMAPHASDWAVRDNQQRCELEHFETGTRVRTMGCHPGRAHGLIPSLILMDEPAQWGPSGEEMFAALITSLGKVPESRAIICGTRAATPSHWFARALSEHEHIDSSHVRVWSADPESEPFDREAWHQANPSLRFGLPLMRYMESDAAAASVDAGALAMFRALRLNAGVSPTAQESGLLSAGVWQDLPPAPQAKGQYVLGLDLGGSRSLSAAVGFWPESQRLDALAACGNIPTLVDRGRQIGLPEVFTDAHDDGHLLVTAGRNANTAGLITEVLERWGPPAVLVADAYRRDDLLDVLDAEPRLGRMRVVFRRMGFGDGAADVRRFKRECYAGRVAPVDMRLLAESVASARLSYDASGNGKLAHRAHQPDDLAAAAVLACAHASRHFRKPKPFKIYVTGRR